MKVNLSSYFLFIVLLIIGYATYLQFAFGLILILYLSAFYFFDLQFSNRYIRLSYFVIFLSFLLAYFLRAFVLVPYPNRFQFSWIDSFSSNDIIKALWQILLYFILTSVGFFIAVKVRVFRNFRGILLKRGTSKFPLGWPVKYFSSITLLLSLLIGLKLALVLFAGVGIKGESVDSNFAFLLRLIPNDLVFIIVAIYLLRYRRQLDGNRKIVLYILVFFMSLSILLTGSKIFLLLFGLCLFIVLMYEGYKFSLAKLGSLSLLGIALIVVSFLVSFTVKNKDPQNTQELIYLTSQQYESLDGMDIADLVTRRFVGLDGYVLSNKMAHSPNSIATQKIKNEFSIKTLILSTLNKLVPFFKFTNALGPGKAIGIYIYGFPESQPFAASVGLLGMFKFVTTYMVWLLCLLFGTFIGWCYNKIYQIKDPDLRLIIFYFISYFFIHSYMSGNFDLLIALLVIKIVLLFVYMQGVILANRLVKGTFRGRGNIAY